MVTIAGQKVIASAFGHLASDVDIGPLFADARGSGAPGVEKTVTSSGFSSLAAAHLTLVLKLKAELEERADPTS